MISTALAAVQRLALGRSHRRNTFRLCGWMPLAIRSTNDRASRGTCTLRPGKSRCARHHTEGCVVTNSFGRLGAFLKCPLRFRILLLQFSDLLSFLFL